MIGTKKTPVLSMLLVMASIIGFGISHNFVKAAIITSPYKWANNYTQVDVSAWPSGWVTPLAQSMSAWNATASGWTFQSQQTGHQFKTANLGNNGLPASNTITGLGYTITDADTTFNTYYSWSTSGEAGKYDVRNVATHELGHWLRLIDSYDASDSEITMYGNTATGETKKRSLETKDVNAIIAMYP